MKKLSISIKACMGGMALAAAFAFSPKANAVPACPDPAVVIQPDGRQITVRLIGDEFYNYMVSADGYTLWQDPVSKVYTYAVLDGTGQLVSTGIPAADPSQRLPQEVKALASIQKNMVPAVTQDQRERRARQNSMAVSNSKELYDYAKFRGLVILVEYTDLKFTMSNPKERFTDMICKANYDGFMSEAAIPEKVTYTGSVRDYFYDNSMGKFEPKFDVIGPVKINYKSTDWNGTSNAATIVRAILSAADPLVDYSKYDTDKDGKIDMFYIIGAGGGANFSGNDSRLLWPHAWSLPIPYLGDGVTSGRYACSTELYGQPSSKIQDGIGTICHEFSHVLGLKDEYDTDYSTNGQSVDPGDWSLMAGGSYLNLARTPVGYSLLQRTQAGFAVPTLIKNPGDYTLTNIDLSNAGYRINTEEPKEYFLLENRRKGGSKWNAYGPGFGMLIFRVDSTDVTVWTNNRINAYASHNYYELIRATPKWNSSHTSVTDSQGDPWPGSGMKTEIDTDTEPALLGWGGARPQFMLRNINENPDGTVSFLAVVDEVIVRQETFEQMTVAMGGQGVQGELGKWYFSEGTAGVAAPSSAWCVGKKAASIVKGGEIVLRGMVGIPKSIEFQLASSSPSGLSAFYFQYWNYTTNEWVHVDATQTQLTVNPKTTKTFKFIMPVKQQTRLRLMQRMGSTTAPVYLDNVKVVFHQEGFGVCDMEADNASLDIETDGLTVTCPGAATPVRVYDITGRLVLTLPVGESVALPAKGLYILTDGRNTRKVVL